MLLSVALGLISLGCFSDEYPMAPGEGTTSRTIYPVVSSLNASPGSQITIGVSTTGSAVLGSLQGTFYYDGSKLRYLGQTPVDSLAFPMTVVNSARAASGELKAITVDPHGLTSTPILLAFEVKGSGYTDRLRFSAEEVVSTELVEIQEPSSPARAQLRAALPQLSTPSLITPDRWQRLLAAVRPRLIDSVKAGRKYGDVDSSGAINGLDVLRLTNWSVGQHLPSEARVPMPGDMAELAGNVAPANLPGLGEASDSKGPGWDASCIRTFNGLDLLAVANESVQQDVPVAGDLIPADAVDTSTRMPRRGSACGGGQPVPAPTDDLDFPDDSLLTVAAPNDTAFIYYRTMSSVRFKANATSSQMLSFLTKYRAQIVGGSEWLGSFVVRYPEPGTTWTAVLDLVTQMRAEPFVESVRPLSRSGGFTVDSRYPSDGQGFQRSTWLGTGDTSWAMRAIRAPLAWGCENGMYGHVPIVGVVEGDFGPIMPDLIISATTPVFREARVARAPHNAAEKEKHRFHGTAMAAALTGTGDNGTGVPGVMWRTDLKRYAIDAPSGIGSADQPATLGAILKQASLDQVRVLSMLIGITVANVDSATVVTEFGDLRNILKKFLDTNPGALIVKSTGNEGTQIAATDLANSPRLGLLAALMSLRLSSAAYRDRIIFVTGADTVGSWRPARWNLFTGGGTDIAAPAYHVALLGLDTAGSPGGPFSHPIVIDSGTSPATAFVAGVAAQLVAFDPSLTPSEVKAYILKGARSPRLSGTSGTLVARVRIGGTQAADSIYMLDAYGSLVAVSNDRAGTPICGYDVSAESNPSGPPTLRLETTSRPGPTYTIPFASHTEVQRVSLAQGGRLIAITSRNTASTFDNRNNETAVLDHLGNVVVVLTDKERLFLERDTADIDLTLQNPRMTLFGPGRGSGGDVFQPLAGELFGDGYSGIERLEISPTGSQIAIEVLGGHIVPNCVNELIHQNEYRWKVLTINGGSPITVAQRFDALCGFPENQNGDVRWDHTGKSAVFALRAETGNGTYGSELIRWSTAGTPSQPVSGKVAFGPWFMADDSLMTTYESVAYATTPCLATIRRATHSSFGNAVGNTRGVSSAFCADASGVTDRSNLRQAHSSNQSQAISAKPATRTRVRTRAN